jgi:hypothetical protein
MSLLRTGLVFLLAIGLALGDLAGASGALCRILCDVRGCHGGSREASRTEPGADDADSCCLERRESGPAYTARTDAGERCLCSVRSPYGEGSRCATTPGPASSELYLTDAWLLDAGPASRCVDPVRARSKRGPPGNGFAAAAGPPGWPGHVAYGGRWSTAMLGCARI